MSIDVAKIEGFEGDFTAEEARNLFNETGEKRNYLCGVCEVPIIPRNVEKDFSAEIFRVPHFSTPKGKVHVNPCDGSVSSLSPPLRALGKTAEESEEAEDFPSKMIEPKPRVVTGISVERRPLTSEEIVRRKRIASFNGEKHRKRSYSCLIEFAAYYCHVVNVAPSFPAANKDLETKRITLLDGREDKFSWVFRRAASTHLDAVMMGQWVFFEQMESVSLIAQDRFRVEVSRRAVGKDKAGMRIFCDVAFGPRVRGVDARLRRELAELVGRKPGKGQAFFVLGKVRLTADSIELMPHGPMWCCVGEIPRPGKAALAAAAAGKAVPAAHSSPRPPN